MNLTYPKSGLGGYKNELKYLYKSEDRNNLIKKLVKKLNNNSLILVNHLEHGELLQELLTISGKETFFIRGSMEVADRIAIIALMEKQDNIICIAMSSIFSTGINITNLHYILFVAGGKSFIRTIQSIGRGLRLHKTKNRLTLFDLYDNMEHSSWHGEERKRFYEKEKIEWKETEIDLR